jgi:choline kinase
MIRSLSGVVVLAVLIFGAIGYRFYVKGQTSDKYLTEAYRLVALSDKYREHQGYLIGICDAAHETAFDHAYSMGGRRRSSKMDEDRYFSELFMLMRDQAVNDRKQDVAESIVRLAEDFAEGHIVLEEK